MWWFKSRAKQLMKELFPAVDDFKCSDHWLRLFLSRVRISLRRKTQDALPQILTFHKRLLQVRSSGVYQAKDIANMDQTPLPFILDDNKTYVTTSSKDVIAKSGSSGLDKRQATVQLTVFGDGVPRIKPLVIFKGKGLRILKAEKEKWDKRVHDRFQPSAWCDEGIMLDWINTQWGNCLTNPSTPGSTGKVLVADSHCAQQTDSVKSFLAKMETALVNVGGGGGGGGVNLISASS